VSKKSFEIARDLKRVRQTVATMLSQLYSRLDALGRLRKRTQGRVSQIENELAQLLRSTKALQDEVAALRNENVVHRLSAIENGRRGGAGGSLASHNHTATALDGGVLTDDEHDGFSEYTEISAPSTPASNKIRLYAKDKAGTSELYYKNDNADERDLSATGGGGSPGGNDDEVQYKSGSSFAGAALTEIDSAGNLRQVGVSSVPSAPTSAIVSYTDDAATRYMPAFRAPVGDDVWLQTATLDRHVVMTNFQDPSTLAYIGGGAYHYGTLNYNPTNSTANNVQSTRHVVLGRNSTATSFTTVGSGGENFWRGNAAGRGGFFYYFRGGVIDLVTDNSRFFFGMAPNATKTTNQDPSAFTDCAGFGKDDTDTTWQFMHNDSSGTATKVNTTLTVTADVLIECFIFCAPNASGTIYWEIRDIDNTLTYTGNVTTDLITSTTYVAPIAWLGLLAGPSWSQFAMQMMYCEADR
jgi:hypothetical protein